MKYDLFLFDADDTLFDFKSCERDAFKATLQHFGHTENVTAVYQTYGVESAALWRELEQNKIDVDFLKAERFRRTFAQHGIQASHHEASARYLETLPKHSNLMEYAEELCRELSAEATVGIITNGFESVQTPRLRQSRIAPYVKFMVVSGQCGFTKPDHRFFEYTAKQVPNFSKARTLVIGDRLETDIAGAHGFGLDACWFNPGRQASPQLRPKFEIAHLSELLPLVI